jgi:predicted enzyme related to lactoylglutathione lyase
MVNVIKEQWGTSGMARVDVNEFSNFMAVAIGQANAREWTTSVWPHFIHRGAQVLYTAAVEQAQVSSQPALGMPGVNSTPVTLSSSGSNQPCTNMDPNVFSAAQAELQVEDVAESVTCQGTMYHVTATDSTKTMQTEYWAFLSVYYAVSGSCTTSPCPVVAHNRAVVVINTTNLDKPTSSTSQLDVEIGQNIN